MKTEMRIYFSALINSIGSWLTFLALALFVSEKYGSHQVAYVFLVQCIPALLLARGVTDLIPVRWSPRVYMISLALLGLNSAMLVYFDSLAAVYVHLIFGAFVKSVSTPLFNSLVGLWVPAEKQVEVQTRLGSIQAGTLALAPMVGGAISAQLGYKALFLMDAMTFVLAMVCLLPNPKILQAVVEKAQQRFSLRRVFAQAVKRPEMISGRLSQYLGIWFIFLSIGAALNALEFSTFAKIALSKDQIGLVVSFWGVGNLVAFVAPKLNEKIGITQFWQAVLFCGGLALFALANSFTMAGLGFFVAGYFFATLSGLIRGQLQQSVPQGVNPLPVWVYANQITQAINIAFYLLFGFLLKNSYYNVSVALLGLTGLAFLWRYRGALKPASSEV